MHLKSRLLFTLFFFNITAYAFYPEVDIDQNNSIFKQIQTDINENSRRIMLKEKTLPVQFYNYQIKEGDTIFSVSSRFNLTYDTIATINKIDNQLFFPRLKRVLIPTCPGVYSEQIKSEEYKELSVLGKKIYLYPGGRFTGEERLNFLISPFSSPVKNTKVTSSYGYRENPFTGKREFHEGLDLRAKPGTRLLAPYKGEVKAASYSESFGNYLIIEHPLGYTSHYFHLQRLGVKKGDIVNRGDLIGRTGNSGRSTGPHLHFEIRLDGETINPSLLLGNV